MTRKKNRRSGLSRKSPEEYDTNENIVLFGLAGKQWGGPPETRGGWQCSKARQHGVAEQISVADQWLNQYSLGYCPIRRIM